MNIYRLVFLQILLLSIILNVASAKKKRESAITDKAHQLSTIKHGQDLRHQVTHHKKHKKFKRSANRRNWSSKLTSYTGYMPPYLVYNRKTGAYHPYYSYPKDNYVSNRRSMQWNNHQQQLKGAK